MYIVFLAGSIASGKSTVARTLQELGCVRIDLDELSRQVLCDGSPVLAKLARAFGADILNQEGQLNRALLAERAFSTPEATQLLEDLEMPAIKALLKEELQTLEQTLAPDAIVVVEVPLLDRIEELHAYAAEIVAVVTPYELRRARAQGRGMSASDFEARAAKQPSDAYLSEHAHTIIHNEKSAQQLTQETRAWLEGARERAQARAQALRYVHD